MTNNLKQLQMLLALLVVTPLAAKKDKDSVLDSINQRAAYIAKTVTIIEEDIDALIACGVVTPISQADLPMVITDSGRYCLVGDVNMNLATITNAGALGATAIAIGAADVDFNLNGNTLNVQGDGNAISTFGTATNVLIRNGTIIGDGVSELNGVQVVTSDVTIRDMVIMNTGYSLEFAWAGVLAFGSFFASTTAGSYTYEAINGLTIERCQFSNNAVGISFYPTVTGVIVRDCTIDSGTYVGIASAERSPNVNNVLIERCSISNCLLGIMTTQVQNNWIIRDCQVSNSGLDGMLLTGLSNLQISNCQIYDSGTNGIFVGTGISSNFELSNCQIFNSGADALSVGYVENLMVRDCEFANYTMTDAPVVKVQDVYDGVISNCYVNSLANLADGMLIRNCHGLTVEDCGVNVVYTNTQGVAPVGINILGSVTGTMFCNCNVSGAPSVGINVGVDSLSLNSQGVIIENCTVQGASVHGINLVEAVSSAVYDSNVFENSLDGIVTNSCSQCVLRNNTVINNGGIGINNTAASVATQIYHNFANNNGTDYAGAPLVTSYGTLSDTTGWFVNVAS